MSIITRRTIVATAAMIVVPSCSRTTSDHNDITAIEAVMRATWERPEAPLGAGPIAVSGDYAVADWTQGDMGGRALLRRDGSWKVVLCAGDGIRTSAGLQGVGVPDQHARELEAELARLERDVTADRLEAMSRFAGVVRME